MKDSDIIARVKAAMPAAEVKAKDLTGGGDHWALEVICKDFQDLTLVQQHQKVYQALGEWMHGPIHALALNTRAE